MRLYSFFSGTKFLIDSYSHIYCYGNQPSILAFRWTFLTWWYKRAGYTCTDVDILQDALPEPSLFDFQQVESQNPLLSFCNLKKPPKLLDDIIKSPAKIFWQASHTKGALHTDALKHNKVAAISCYDIKEDEMMQALCFYMFHAFKVTVKPEKLKKTASYLCQEPHFFFSQAFKIAMGGDSDQDMAPLSDDDVIGPLRFQSAVLLKTLVTASTSTPFAALTDLRHQEILVKSGSQATHSLLNYYGLKSFFQKD